MMKERKKTGIFQGNSYRRSTYTFDILIRFFLILTPHRNTEEELYFHSSNQYYYPNQKSQISLPFKVKYLLNEILSLLTMTYECLTN
jgi:hypothetical protein